LAEAQYKYGFLFVTFPYSEAVKGGDNIKFSIDFGLAKPFKGLVYKRYKISGFNYNSVKSSIVNIELNTFS